MRGARAVRVIRRLAVFQLHHAALQTHWNQRRPQQPCSGWIRKSRCRMRRAPQQVRTFVGELQTPRMCGSWTRPFPQPVRPPRFIKGTDHEDLTCTRHRGAVRRHHDRSPGGARRFSKTRCARDAVSGATGRDDHQPASGGSRRSMGRPRRKDGSTEPAFRAREPPCIAHPARTTELTPRPAFHPPDHQPARPVRASCLEGTS